MNDKLAPVIVKALGYLENGGKPDLDNPKSGKTGELKSIFQFIPATWKHDAGKYLGDPNAPLTPDHETKVMLAKVKEQLDSGYSPEQIFSMHNAGSGEPNAWKGKFEKNTGSHHAGDASKGVNSQYQVPFDVPGYVKKGMSLVNQFSAEDGAGEQSTQPPQNDQHMNTILSMIKQASSPQGPAQAPTQQAQPPSGAGLLAQLIQPKTPSMQQ